MFASHASNPKQLRNQNAESRQGGRQRQLADGWNAGITVIDTDNLSMPHNARVEQRAAYVSEAALCASRACSNALLGVTVTLLGVARRRAREQTRLEDHRAAV